MTWFWVLVVLAICAALVVAWYLGERRPPRDRDRQDPPDRSPLQ